MLEVGLPHHVFQEACHFWEGQLCGVGCFQEFEWVWDPLTEVQNLSLSALPMRPF